MNRKRLCMQGDTLFDTEHSAPTLRVEHPNERWSGALQPIIILGSLAFPTAFATYTASAHAHICSCLAADVLPLTHQLQTPPLTALISGRTLTAGVLTTQRLGASVKALPTRLNCGHQINHES